MTREQFRNKLCLLSDHKLYELSKKMALRENLGFNYSRWKCDIIADECHMRGIDAFDDAIRESAVEIDSIESINLGSAIVRYGRLTYMTDIELIRHILKKTGIENEGGECGAAFLSERLAVKLGISKSGLLFCRVEGDSMINAGINNGDILIVDSGFLPRHQEIGLVSVNGKKFVKRLLIDNEGVSLKSENPAYKTVRVNEKMVFEIIGSVKQVISF